MPIPWDQTEVELARCGRVRCEPAWRLDEHFGDRLEDLDLWFVWAGKGVMHSRQGQIILRPGICLWMRPGGKYTAEHDPEDRLGVTFIHFDIVSRTTRKRRNYRELPPEVHDVADVGLFESVMRRITDLMRDATAPTLPNQPPPSTQPPASQIAATMLRGLLMDLDAGSHQPWARTLHGGTERHHHQLMMETAALIAEDPAAAPSMVELAARAGYTPDHFSRIFRRVLGMSPQSYAVEARLSRARVLLLETALPVGRIAEVLGYQDVYYFSRQFSEKTGMSPRKYRATGGAMGAV